MGWFSSQWFARWYLWLDRLSGGIGGPIYRIAQDTRFPVLAALLLGLLGATAPCQLSVNLAAMGLVVRRAPSPSRAYRQALGIIVGKVLTYTLLGGVAIGLGLKATQLVGYIMPAATALRRLVGPLFVLSGLVMLGLFRVGFSWGGAWWDRWSAAWAQRGLVGDVGTGALLALGFCPTMFWVFFGLLVPLGVRNSEGLLFPAVFAIGTALPLIVAAWLATAGGELTRRALRNVYALNRLATRLAGVIFLLIGLNDVILYWYL